MIESSSCIFHTEPKYLSGIPELSRIDQSKRPTTKACLDKVIFSRQIYIQVIPLIHLPGSRKNRVMRVLVTATHRDY